MPSATILVTVPNLVSSEKESRKRGMRVEELSMTLPTTLTHSQLRMHTEAEIQLMGLQHSCIQVDVYHADRLLASYKPVR